MSFTETEMTVLATIAYHQPISRTGLSEMFGREVSRDLISRLQFKKLIGFGNRPKSAINQSNSKVIS